MDWAILTEPTSDPVCSVVLGDEDPRSTSVLRKTVSPVWDERFVFDCADADAVCAFTVEDEDRFFMGKMKTRDFMGSCRVRGPASGDGVAAATRPGSSFDASRRRRGDETWIVL